MHRRLSSGCSRGILPAGGSTRDLASLVFYSWRDYRNEPRRRLILNHVGRVSRKGISLKNATETIEVSTDSAIVRWVRSIAS
jgi:hypothetical protein